MGEMGIRDPEMEEEEEAILIPNRGRVLIGFGVARLMRVEGTLMGFNTRRFVNCLMIWSSELLF